MMTAIAEYPDYYIDEFGKIYSQKSGRLKELKQFAKNARIFICSVI